jgi:hypothetical protein
MNQYSCFVAMRKRYCVSVFGPDAEIAGKIVYGVSSQNRQLIFVMATCLIISFE